MKNRKYTVNNNYNVDIGGVIITNYNRVERNDRCDISTILNKNLRADNSLLDDKFTPETALKLFSHTNDL